MDNNIKQPEFEERNFICPHCGVLSLQNWESNRFHSEYTGWTDFKMCSCEHCKAFTIWHFGQMIYPDVVTAPIAHEDMPESVCELYDEARQVSPKSARAAAALLRVALEKLTEELGETDGTLNSRIGKLKAQGLPDKVIKSLDIVRINANEGGSHSGEIDLTGEDGEDVVNTLFWLVNYTVEKTITENNEIDDAFGQLPENKRDGIDLRDNV